MIMPKSNLTPEDKAKLIEAINNGTEPPADILPKLFPGTAEKFDVQALDRAKIPTLEYAGKRSKAAILAEASAGIGAAPLRTVRCFGNVNKGEWRNLIVQGDNLQFLKTCYNNTDPLIKNKVRGKVKLIYIDPPFATKSEFGGKDGEQSYADKVAAAEFIESLRERLIYLCEMLAEDGSIYVHLDQKMNHYAKVILDEIFGRKNFVNEIIWLYNTGGIPKKCGFAKKHDTIFLYCNNKSKITWNAQLAKTYIRGDFFRPEQKRAQELGIKQDAYGLYRMTTMKDVWEIGALFRNSTERVNYPTQKPEEILNRIISTSTDKGDLVLDCFAGSGTTPSVAEKLGRRWIACDFGKHSIYTMQRRILRIGESKALVDVEDKSGKVVKKKGPHIKKMPNHFALFLQGLMIFPILWIYESIKKHM